jgi:hypothetical protein
MPSAFEDHVLAKESVIRYLIFFWKSASLIYRRRFFYFLDFLLAEVLIVFSDDLLDSPPGPGVDRFLSLLAKAPVMMVIKKIPSRTINIQERSVFGPS